MANLIALSWHRQRSMVQVLGHGVGLQRTGKQPALAAAATQFGQQAGLGNGLDAP